MLNRFANLIGIPCVHKPKSIDPVAPTAERSYIGAPKNLGAKPTIINSNLTNGSGRCQLRNAGANLLTSKDVACAQHIKPRAWELRVPTANAVGVDECA